jgi:hypothetical protein
MHLHTSEYGFDRRGCHCTVGAGDAPNFVFGAGMKRLSGATRRALPQTRLQADGGRSVGIVGPAAFAPRLKEWSN